MGLEGQEQVARWIPCCQVWAAPLTAWPHDIHDDAQGTSTAQHIREPLHSMVCFSSRHLLQLPCGLTIVYMGDTTADRQHVDTVMQCPSMLATISAGSEGAHSEQVWSMNVHTSEHKSSTDMPLVPASTKAHLFK